MDGPSLNDGRSVDSRRTVTTESLQNRQQLKSYTTDGPSCTDGRSVVYNRQTPSQNQTAAASTRWTVRRAATDGPSYAKLPARNQMTLVQKPNQRSTSPKSSNLPQTFKAPKGTCEKAIPKESSEKDLPNLTNFQRARGGGLKAQERTTLRFILLPYLWGESRNQMKYVMQQGVNQKSNHLARTNHTQRPRNWDQNHHKKGEEEENLPKDAISTRKSFY